jgi:DNA-binding MarR family transcriptional regulator
MSQLFETKPVRMPARRGRSSFPIVRSRPGEKWPPPDRESVDIALVAARVLAVSGRLHSRLRRTARRAGVEPGVVQLLLLYSESNRWLRIVDVAELLGIGTTTASRLATRAEAVGLIDKLTSSIDGREVACRLSVAGRSALTRCLESLRPDAIAVLGRADRAWIEAAQQVLEPSSRFDLRTQNWGWRAGVRAGMPAGE